MLGQFYTLNALIYSFFVKNAEKMSRNRTVSSFIPTLPYFTSSHSHTYLERLGILRNCLTTGTSVTINAIFFT